MHDFLKYFFHLYREFRESLCSASTVLDHTTNIERKKKMKESRLRKKYLAAAAVQE